MTIGSKFFFPPWKKNTRRIGEVLAKIVIEQCHETFISPVSTFSNPHNHRQEHNRSCSQGLWLGGISRPDFRHSLDWCWFGWAQLRRWILFTISSGTDWLVPFGSLWTAWSPGLCLICLIVFCKCVLAHTWLPLSKTAEGWVGLFGSRAESVLVGNLCDFKGQLVIPDGRGKPILNLVCVCSLQQAWFLVKDCFLFSMGYPQLKKEGPWWVNELPCRAHWIICLVFLTKWEALTAQSGGVGKRVSSW